MYYNYNDRKTTLSHQTLSAIFDKFLCLQLLDYYASSLFLILRFFFEEKDEMYLTVLNVS